VRKPVSDDYTRITACVISSLPDSPKERRATLESLLAILPEKFEHRSRAAELLDLMDAIERKQMDFLSALVGRRCCAASCDSTIQPFNDSTRR
jgi:hypothetical protein